MQILAAFLELRSWSTFNILTVRHNAFQRKRKKSLWISPRSGTPIQFRCSDLSRRRGPMAMFVESRANSRIDIAPHLATGSKVENGVRPRIRTSLLAFSFATSKMSLRAIKIAIPMHRHENTNSTYSDRLKPLSSVL